MVHITGGKRWTDDCNQLFHGIGYGFSWFEKETLWSLRLSLQIIPSDHHEDDRVEKVSFHIWHRLFLLFQGGPK